MKKIITGLSLILNLVVLSACAPYILEEFDALEESETGHEPFEGYIGPVGSYRWQGRGTILRLDGNTVSMVLDDEEVASGVYEVEGDEYVITVDGATLRADSFVDEGGEYIRLTSGEGVLGMLSGVIFSRLTENQSAYHIESLLTSIEDEFNHAESIEESEFLEVYHSSTLNGSYTAQMFVGLTRTLQFEGDTVITIFDDQETNIGTYEIDGNELIMTIDGLNIRANLSANGESFTVTSADHLLGMISGITFTEE